MRKNPTDEFSRTDHIVPVPCPFDGFDTTVTKEGLLKCSFCKRTFQSQGLNYRILERR